jgi:p-aminobenzoyl-glutamate transporter AbgT
MALIIIVGFAGLIAALWHFLLGGSPRNEKIQHEKIQHFLSLFKNKNKRERRRNAITLIVLAIVSCVFILPEMARWMVLSGRSTSTAWLAPLAKYVVFVALFFLGVAATFYAIWKAVKLWHEDNEEEEEED